MLTAIPERSLISLEPYLHLHAYLVTQAHGRLVVHHLVTTVQWVTEAIFVKLKHLPQTLLSSV